MQALSTAVVSCMAELYLKGGGLRNCIAQAAAALALAQLWQRHAISLALERDELHRLFGAMLDLPAPTLLVMNKLTESENHSLAKRRHELRRVYGFSTESLDKRIPAKAGKEANTIAKQQSQALGQHDLHPRAWCSRSDAHFCFCPDVVWKRSIVSSAAQDGWHSNPGIISSHQDLCCPCAGSENCVTLRFVSARCNVEFKTSYAETGRVLPQAWAQSTQPKLLTASARCCGWRQMWPRLWRLWRHTPQGRFLPWNLLWRQSPCCAALSSSPANRWLYIHWASLISTSASLPPVDLTLKCFTAPSQFERALLHSAQPMQTKSNLVSRSLTRSASTVNLCG